MTLPIINVQETTAKQAFVTSLRETGFAVLDRHPISLEQINRIYALWGDFFNSEEKHHYAFDTKTHAGFVCASQSETAKGSALKDLKEFFHYFPGCDLPESLRSETQALFECMQRFASELLDWIQDELPDSIRAQLTQSLSSMIDRSPHTLLRLLHYPPVRGDFPAGAIRAAAHEDISLLTLLPSATEKGLQVQLKDGTWEDVPCQQGWLIVNVGDMLAECTAHYLEATSHRVINPEGADLHRSRISCPLFLHANDEVALSERHTAASYRRERFKELGLL